MNIDDLCLRSLPLGRRVIAGDVEIWNKVHADDGEHVATVGGRTSIDQQDLADLFVASPLMLQALKLALPLVEKSLPLIASPERTRAVLTVRAAIKAAENGFEP